MKRRLNDIIRKQKSGYPEGITSICSSNPFVIETAIQRAKNHDNPVLIESTSNQVDQFGGYSGMTPWDFVRYIKRFADKHDFSMENVILGGDHLGPNVWQSESPGSALKKAHEQIKAYTEAGYTKIHLDASMPLKGDPVDIRGALPVELAAARAAELCHTAEETIRKTGLQDHKPVYVIGTDVPIPGGAQHRLTDIQPTTVSEVQDTIQRTRQAFENRQLTDAWKRVIAVVVQPGVEFSSDMVLDYDRHRSESLSRFIRSDEQLVYEAHSTDYQRPEALKAMVEDQYMILKVGPWLTFAFREAIFALIAIEQELLSHRKNVICSELRKIIDTEMNNHPKYWEKHYQGSETEINFQKFYSYSDRIRYYWPNKNVDAGVRHLMQNLSTIRIPQSLISQYLPEQYQKIRNGELLPLSADLIQGKISDVLHFYDRATKPVTDFHHQLNESQHVTD